MKVVFLSNFLLHHQTEYCETMYSLCDGNFYFIATSAITEERKKLGYHDYSDDGIPYYIDGTNEANRERIETLINDADAVMIGSAPWYWVEKRVADGKLVYVYSERIFKTLIASAKAFLKGTISTRYIKAGRKPNVKLFCASAYLPKEMRLLNTFKNRMYRWGYFSPLCPEAVKEDNDIPTIVFAARLIPLKRPFYTLRLAKDFKQKGIKANFIIVGRGELEQQLKDYVAGNGLQDTVTFTGAVPPDEVRKYMDCGDIFVFTSTKQEGWGAVLNEAMNSSCAVVASDKIGSAPFLIEDGKNGLLFKDGSYNDFKEKVLSLCQNRERARTIGQEAYKSISTLWNGRSAAERFVVLTEHFLKGEDTPFENGPCSKVTK